MPSSLIARITQRTTGVSLFHRTVDRTIVSAYVAPRLHSMSMTSALSPAATTSSL